MLIDNVIRLPNASLSVWDDVLSCLRSSLSANSFDMWFGKKNLTLDGIEDGCANLIAANELVASWINGQFRDAILNAFKQVLPEVSDYKISVSKNSKASQVQVLSTEPEVVVHKHKFSAKKKNSSPKTQRFSNHFIRITALILSSKATAIKLR